jgi:tRNA pseudouridine32 synthase/23S rRNA pseudouridine746 synthase
MRSFAPLSVLDTISMIRSCRSLLEAQDVMPMQKLAQRRPLPLRNGVAASTLWLPEGQSWPDTLSFLQVRLPAFSRDDLWRRMRAGDIVDEGGVALGPESPYVGGRHLFYYRVVENETPIPFEERIVYEDADILVADKPHFLPVVPAGRFLEETLQSRLRRRSGNEELVPIHRIDRETAGLVLLSKKQASRGRWQHLFERRLIEKTYEAIVQGPGVGSLPQLYRSRIVKAEPFFRMQEVEGDANSEVSIEVIRKEEGIAHVRLRPVTGRKHQLRVQMAALGAPILNDPFYPKLTPDKGDDFSAPLCLLAKSLELPHPEDGRRLSFHSDRRLVG